MKSSDLKPSHQDSVIAQMLDLKSSIDFLRKDIMPLSYQMESFELKEYQNILNKDIEDLKVAKSYIIENEAIFNEILCSYNLSVAFFINKFIL